MENQEPIHDNDEATASVQAMPTTDAPESTNVAPRDFFDIPREQLAAELERDFQLPKYRADQLFQWAYRHAVADFSSMTNLKQEFREALATRYTFPKPIIRERQISNDGTRKYMFEVDNGDLVETVMIKQPTRMTLCVSSQVGCAMGCKFCRTATMGLKRHLRTSEIIQQVVGVIADAKNFNDMFQNVVFMGMGEPLHNFDGVCNALRIMKDPHGLAIAPRKITISSVGLVPAIERFGQTGIDVNLAISLNATDDAVRAKIMPINKGYPIERLLQTLRAYPLSSARKRITIEYVMLSGVNDREEDLKRLPKLLHGIPAKINLIPYNTNAGLGFEQPSKDRISYWQRTLMSRGIETTVRWSKGQDIAAACGQLVTSSQQKKKAKSLEVVSTAA